MAITPRLINGVQKILYMNNSIEDHLVKKHSKSKKNHRRLVLFAVLFTVLIAVTSALFIPVKPNNVLFQKNSHHKFNYPETYIIEDPGSHYISTIIDPDSDFKATVISYFLTGKSDIQDLKTQFYSDYFVDDKLEDSDVYQFQNDYVLFRKNENVVLALEYKKEDHSKVMDFIDEETLWEIGDSTKFQDFSANQYRDILNHVVYDGALPINDPQYVVNEKRADKYIRALAFERGYKQRVLVDDSNIVLVEDFPIADTASEGLELLLAAARDAGHDIKILSTYRNVDIQRQLFLSRYSGSSDSIAIQDGEADGQLQQTMNTTAPPGMSKHHSSYTVDLAEDGVFFTNFKNTATFEWLSKNDYENSKRFGFVPSYPEDATNQGPNPEAWEYTFVGSDILTR